MCGIFEKFLFKFHSTYKKLPEVYPLPKTFTHLKINHRKITSNCPKAHYFLKPNRWFSTPFSPSSSLTKIFSSLNLQQIHRLPIFGVERRFFGTRRDAKFVSVLCVATDRRILGATRLLCLERH